MRSQVVSTRRSRALVWALAFALWCAATLGLVHSTLHNPLSGHSDGPLAAVSSAHGDEPSKERGLAALFGDHHSDADCRLYDQLAHGPAALGVPAVILPVIPPAAVFAALAGEAIARWVALFDARGPPSPR